MVVNSVQPTKCYIYTRVSTAMQVDGFSLDAQREKLRTYAKFQGMVIAGEYSDATVIIGLNQQSLGVQGVAPV